MQYLPQTDAKFPLYIIYKTQYVFTALDCVALKTKYINFVQCRNCMKETNKAICQGNCTSVEII